MNARATLVSSANLARRTTASRLGLVLSVTTALLLATACGSSSFTSGAATTAARENTPTASAGASNPSGSGSTSSTGSGTTSGANSGSGSNNAAENGSGTTQPPPPNIGFGLLVNDLNCTFCHLEVHGTVVSVATVPAFRSDSHGEVYGKWLVNGAYNAPQGLSNPPTDGGIVISSGNATSSYNNSGGELPVNTAGVVAFPTIDFTSLSAKMQGSAAASVSPSAPLTISKSYTGNVLMVGTQAQPIIIDKDILINGDLVIKGYYTGIGTIYVTGNIYIPANLKALSLASFPYSDTPTTADKAALADMATGTKDALGLATANNIFVGDIENYMDASSGGNSGTTADGIRLNTLYDAAFVSDPLMLNTNNGVRNLYNWLPEAKMDLLYENGTPCWTSSNRTLVAGHHWGEREFSEIDSYLYAAKAIGGIDRASNWTINGGMIAQAMHIVSGAGSDSVAANATCGASRINFDYRMRNGLQVLEALSSAFPGKGAESTAVSGNGSGT